MDRPTSVSSRLRRRSRARPRTWSASSASSAPGPEASIPERPTRGGLRVRRRRWRRQGRRVQSHCDRHRVRAEPRPALRRRARLARGLDDDAELGDPRYASSVRARRRRRRRTRRHLRPRAERDRLRALERQGFGHADHWAAASRFPRRRPAGSAISTATDEATSALPAPERRRRVRALDRARLHKPTTWLGAEALRAQAWQRPELAVTFSSATSTATGARISAAEASTASPARSRPEQRERLSGERHAVAVRW